MLTDLFTWLTNAVQGNPAIAITAALLWGILSILLSPCHLASIPLIIGFIDKQGRISIKRAFFISLVFALGILITIAAIGLITASLGRLMGDVGNIGNYLVALIFVVVGLYLLDIIKLDWGGFASSSIKQKGWLAALILGLLFGIGLGPCTFAFMAPMLGVVFQVAAKQLVFAIALLAAFGIGHCSVIVLAGTLTEKVQKYLNWTEKTDGAFILRRVCGVLVILGGIYFLLK
ncbi:cytochrome C biogenesis protein [candidate division KSB1 bacterium]|nr:cytochrome C biogenesis protein [candidate division KSB1 bacterium]MBL7092487.1 cytochrome C biogenesis protein [candidate division KSB1 bacterium]